MFGTLNAAFLIILLALGTTVIAADEAATIQSLLVVNKLGDTLSIIDTETGKERARVPVGEGPHEVDASPDGRIAVVTNYGRVTPGNSLSVIAVAEGEVIRTIDLGEHTRPHGVAFLADGKRVAVTTEGSRRLLVVNIESGEILHAIDTEQEISHMVELTRDQRFAYVPNIRSGSVSIIDLKENRLAKIVETGPGAEGVAVHPNQPEVWISNRAADTVSIIDTESMEVIDTIESRGFPIRAAIAPDGRHAIIVNARAGAVTIFDAQDRSEARTIAMEAEVIIDENRMFPRAFSETTVPIGAIFSPDGSRAFVALTRSDVVAVIDTQTWEIIDKFATDKEPDGLGWSVIERRARPEGIGDTENRPQ
jgi:YVTN family beta-propeller protein